MKTMKLTLAFGFALSVVGTSAFAIAPAVVPDVVVNMAGSSAQDDALGRLFANQLCVSGTLDKYLGPSNGKDYRAYYCTMNGTTVPGLAGTRNVLLYKRSKGGSAYGAQPVAQGAAFTPAVTFMKVSATNCTLSATPNVWSCTANDPADLFGSVVQAGITDVEPKLFKGINKPADPGFTDISTVELGNLVINSQNAVSFGVTVTTKLYRALQKMQGLDSTKDDATNMPSLAASQVAGLATGGVKSWANLKESGGLLRSLNNAAFGTPPANPNVYMCRRAQGSGTQAQFNAVFLQAPCTTPVASPLVANGTTVIDNASGGDLVACQNAFDLANLWAIGIQGTSTAPSVTDNWRFIKINRVSPDIKNVADGKYFDWVEQSLQWNKNLGTNTDPVLIFKQIASLLGNPADLAVNAQTTQTWGKGGALALGTKYAPTYPFDYAKPINRQTKSVSGQPNACLAGRVIAATPAQ
jgi:hypothetical protein